MIVIGSHMIEIERVTKLEVHKELLWRKNHWANFSSRGKTSRSAKKMHKQTPAILFLHPKLDFAFLFYSYQKIILLHACFTGFERREWNGSGKKWKIVWGSKLELTLGVLFCSLIELGKCSSTFAPMPFSTPYRTKFVLNILWLFFLVAWKRSRNRAMPLFSNGTINTLQKSTQVNESR